MVGRASSTHKAHRSDTVRLPSSRLRLNKVGLQCVGLLESFREKKNILADECRTVFISIIKISTGLWCPCVMPRQEGYPKKGLFGAKTLTLSSTHSEWLCLFFPNISLFRAGVEALALWLSNGSPIKLCLIK